MKATTFFAFILIAHSCVTLAYADTVVIGYPLDYTTTSGLFPGLGEDTSADTVPRLGQTFTVPAGHPYLTTFSFWLSDSPFFQPQPTTFDAVLMAYGPDRPIGPVIYQSTSQSTLGWRMQRDDDSILMSVRCLTRSQATSSFSTRLLISTAFRVTRCLHLKEPMCMAEGVFAYSDFATGLPSPITRGNPVDCGWDVIFRAEFNVPEPSSLALVTIAGILITKCRRSARGLGMRRRHPQWRYRAC